ncbi:hypothetical protein CDV31_001860 [Fusarium ambrosium]|uniref:DUF7600 domain-containing protein n=1 Tax=Fusarium ambrosium TaxID=131363 RepID=A0A428UY27_9HYPO|nr:hypothetical protein CDV31_001860 [Fusarium ambrosium]
MRYCVLCGIPITRLPNEPWLQEFRAVWVETTHWDHVKLSGVGICSEFDQVGVDSVPRDVDKRYDDPKGPGPIIDVELRIFQLEHLIPLEYRVREPQAFWGWAFHSSCWDLLNQTFTPDLNLIFAALLSVPIGLDGIINWGHTYGGAAAFRRRGSVSTLISCFPDFFYIPPDYRSDPLRIPGLTKAMNNDLHPKDDTSHCRFEITNFSLEKDIFSRLAPELLEQILTILPTRDVHSLRLASPIFAMLDLSGTFWASRFRQGSEFQHMTEVSHNTPKSWKTLYLTVRGLSRDNPNMASRRRVWKLVQCLQTTVSQMANTPCHGTPLESWFESFMPTEASKEEDLWQTAKRGVIDSEARFHRGCRVLRARTLHFSQPLRVQSMSVSLVHTGMGVFVSGLVFIYQDGTQDALGYIHQDQSVPIQFSTPQQIQGWQLALDTSGIRSIAIVTEDGAVSPWAGEPEDFPKWHLAEDEDISAIRAEFDAFKMVSLSRNKPRLPSKHEWRNSRLWYNVPPDHLLFDGNDEYHSQDSSGPIISTVLFGGPDRRFISSLVEIVIWTFNGAYIGKMEFLYADASQNQHLGDMEPFGSVPSTEQRDSYQRTSMAIDSAGGEELVGIEVKEMSGYVIGLKLRTNFGREVTSPQHLMSNRIRWRAIRPTGSKVVGLFSTHSHIFQSLGLISTSLGVEGG